MIPNTLPFHLVIRFSIWGLRAVAPASILYCALPLIGYRFLPWPLEVFAYIEAFFYLFINLPRQRSLNNARPRTVPRSRQERRELFERCWSSVPDVESFLSIWFEGAPLDSIHREDLKDFLAWGFFYKTEASVEDDHELEEYLHRTEDTLGRTFAPGRGTHRPMKVSTDPLRLQQKPFFFYAVGNQILGLLKTRDSRMQFAIGADDLMTYLTAHYIGLHHYRLPLHEFFSVFPLRPHTLFSKYTSTSSRVSYWYRPHTSTTRLPVLFIHGIGAGMRTYTGFFRDFIREDTADDGQVGIIALELMPISMRVTRGILPRAEMLTEIMKIINHHGWEIFAIIGHSYGTIIATHILRELEGTGRVGPLMLVDPVTLSIHWGGIPYNFLYRHPRKASEWQLHYFASTDMGVAHSITRRFDWSENVLWRDEMKDRTITVVLAGGDIVLDPYALVKYLSESPELKTQFLKRPDFERAQGISGAAELNILWYDKLNHSEVFDSASAWKPLVEILHRYCRLLKQGDN